MKAAENKKANAVGIDWSITIPSLVLLLGICVLFLTLNMQNDQILADVYGFITNTFGGVYHIFIFANLLLVCYIAFSKIGHIKLGSGRPTYSTFTWVAMLFCTCIGCDIMYWGMVEWAFYMDAPPLGLAPMSAQAAEISVTYSMFHWGISGWATYALGAIIIAYYYFVKKKPNLRISVSCGFTKENGKETLGKIVDICVIIGLCAGVATGIAVSSPMISYCLQYLFGVQPTTEVNIIIGLAWSLVFAASAASGIEKGIKRLSDANVTIAIALIIFVLLVGNAGFIINNIVNSLGVMLQNYWMMSFNTDPVTQGGFPQVWTIFYWAWWFTFVPIMGLFIARISYGRTIRQVAVGTTLFGSLGCWLFLSVFGSYGLGQQLSGAVDMVGIVKNEGGHAAMIALLDSLPFPQVVITVFLVISFIFLATTGDSSAYTIASVSATNLRGESDPKRSARILWGFAIVIWPVALLIGGGLEVVKLCSVLGSIPILVILFIMIRNFLRDARAQAGIQGGPAAPRRKKKQEQTAGNENLTSVTS